MVISDDATIAECFNLHFITVTDSLEMDYMFKQVHHYTEIYEKEYIAPAKYNNHQSPITI